MKTLIDTRIYNDTWFFSLSQEAKWLFIFLLTNNNCNLIGCYELPMPIIGTYTGLTPKMITDAFTELAAKVSYTDGWVIIRNYENYNPMRNPSIEDAKEKLINSLPKHIKAIFEAKGQGVDTLVPGSKETVTVKEIRGIVKGDFHEQLTQINLVEIAEKYQVPIAFVNSKLDDLENWISEKPTRARGRDLRRTLMAWVKKDALERREHGSRKIKYVGEALSDSN